MNYEISLTLAKADPAKFLRNAAIEMERVSPEHAAKLRTIASDVEWRGLPADVVAALVERETRPGYQMDRVQRCLIPLIRTLRG